MRNNNTINYLINLVSRANGNPQDLAMNILKNNPNFARAIQGQDPKALAIQELQKRGINPDMIEKLIRK